MIVDEAQYITIRYLSISIKLVIIFSCTILISRCQSMWKAKKNLFWATQNFAFKMIPHQIWKQYWDHHKQSKQCQKCAGISIYHKIVADNIHAFAATKWNPFKKNHKLDHNQLHDKTRKSENSTKIVHITSFKIHNKSKICKHCERNGSHKNCTNVNTSLIM